MIYERKKRACIRMSLSRHEQVQKYVADSFIRDDDQISRNRRKILQALYTNLKGLDGGVAMPFSRLLSK